MSILAVLRERIKNIRDSIKAPGPGASITYMKYPPECNFDGKRVLNLGCGNTTYKAKNVVNLDSFDIPGVDVVWDLSKTPMPFKEGEFDLIVANHIFEHIENWWGCFKDCARILKVGGKIEIWLPGENTYSQMGYRDHINHINYVSFAGTRGKIRNFANAWELDQKKKNGFANDMEMVGYMVLLQRWWWLHVLPNFMRQWCIDHLNNVINEMGYVFEKLLPEGR